MGSLTENHTMDLLYLWKDTFVLFMKLFFITKIKILKNTLERIMLTQKYRGLPPNTFNGPEAYGTQ